VCVLCVCFLSINFCGLRFFDSTIFHIFLFDILAILAIFTDWFLIFAFFGFCWWHSKKKREEDRNIYRRTHSKKKLVTLNWNLIGRLAFLSFFLSFSLLLLSAPIFLSLCSGCPHAGRICCGPGIRVRIRVTIALSLQLVTY